MSKLYYLQCVTRGYIGNSPVFWRKGGGGYTQWLDDAEQFTADEVASIVRGTRSSHKWRRFEVKKLDSISQRTVDMQQLHRIAPKKRKAPSP